MPAAIAYSRKNLSAWAPSHISEVQQGMTLLAFGERTGVGSYRVSLLSVKVTQSDHFRNYTIERNGVQYEISSAKHSSPSTLYHHNLYSP